ncbi:MAG: MarR family transcriptional regulator [Melioribacteraceae bacterium]|nr:MarR family transcriptional regulator [Melioribacteraceae bacterium]
MGAAKSYGKKNDLALNTWIKLARAHSVIAHLSDENIRGYNLTTPQFGVIEALGHLGPLRVGQLCNKMLVSGGNMTLVLDNLEKQQLIERTFSKEDRRAILIQLTQKGVKLFEKIFSDHADRIGEIFSILSVDEQKALGDLLKKLGKSLTKR